MKKATLFAIALALLFSCSKKDDADPEKDPEKAKRTVLVYVAGDNNLTSSGYNYFNYDLQQMMEGTKNLSTNNNLILFVDQYGKKPFFIKVEKGDTLHLKSMETEMKSSSEETLSMAMKYAVEEFPAESYGLVLWGHADGWITRSDAAAHPSSRASRLPKKAYGMDENGGKKWMNITNMAKTLAKQPKLKFIFADCCCFLCVENVYELRHCAEYIIGSPAEIPGEGAPYQTVVPAMFSQNDDFYKEIVDRYYEQKSYDYDVPLAAVNTSKLEDLAQATATTMASFANDIEPYGDNCRYPNVDGLIFYFDHTQFDMQDFMLRYASTEQYKEWKRVFDLAVPCRTFANVWMANHVKKASFNEFNATEERQGALGMFLPQKDSDMRWWISDYIINLGKTMTEMNSEIKGMQWYDAARLAEMGW